MSRRAVIGRNAGWALLLWLIGSAALAAQSYPVETLRSSGTPEHRIDIAVLGDGYRAEDQTQLSSDAKAVMDKLFGYSPFQEYAALFNVKLVHVVSQDRGATDGSAGGTVSTALSAHYGCNGLDRLLCVDDEAAARIAAQNVPEYDVLVVVVNDPKYGGSGGQVATVSLAPLASDILRHELGHTLAHLADEYSDPYPGYPACSTSSGGDCPEANATTVTDRSKLKWGSWVDAQTPVPTSTSIVSASTSPVGEFEGCRYQSTGIYRPVADACLMKRLETDAGQSEQLCPVCTEAMVEAFWDQASMVDDFQPASVTPEVTPCGPVTFSVSTPPIDSARMLYLWSVDGAARSIDVQQIQLSTQDLTPGHHTVTALIQDHTPLVRDDPKGAMQQTQSWDVDVQQGPPGTCQPGPCEETAACSDGKCITTLKPVGTPCGPASCVDGVEAGPKACNAQGACVPTTAPESCAPFTCDSSAVQCRAGCASDAECTDGNRCVSGTCQSTTQPVPPKRGCEAVPGGLGALVALAGLFRRAARRRSRR